jgi:hypothetical protein
VVRRASCGPELLANRAPVCPLFAIQDEIAAPFSRFVMRWGQHIITGLITPILLWPRVAAHLALVQWKI